MHGLTRCRVTRMGDLPSSRSKGYNAGMRIFLAGASGVIGQSLIPRLVQAGHVVGGLTRSPSKRDLLIRLGAEPIVCDVFNREALLQAVGDFKPDVVLHELTDLPDDAAQISERADLNARIRTEGTRNLIEAARQSGSPKILAQSIAWKLPDGPDGQAVAELERSVLDEGGVVLRYGQFYGPGTYHEEQPPEEPRVHIDRAAERTLDALSESAGVLLIVD
jgi:NAD(P)-dependent dehydrogenase (short-subunit alcohol dehydrogenase family)